MTTTKLALLAAAVCAAPLIALGTAAVGAPPDHAATCRLPMDPGAHTVEVEQNGIERPLLLYVPAEYAGKRVPLVFLLHGGSGTGELQASVPDTDGRPMFLDDADANGYALAAPDGGVFVDLGELGSGYRWNVDPIDPAYPDEVEYIDLAIDAISETICIDDRRVYAVGASSGGRMASTLACELSDRIAAIGPIMRITAPEGCAPSRPVPSVTINGLLDPRTPREEILDALSRWAQLNGCQPSAPKVTLVTENVDLWRYRACHANGDVWFYDVKDGGHTFPGAATPPHLEPFVGPTNQEIRTPEVIWAFLRTHKL